MGYELILKSSRGTKLYQNTDTKMRINLDSKGYLSNSEFLIIQGNSISLHKLTTDVNPLIIPFNQAYMVVNLSDHPFLLTFSHDYSKHFILFDPYRYEKHPPDVINPKEFEMVHNVPKGYIDILPKWYSIKFTYPTRNIIYIRPNLGISIQKHTKRTEEWRILEGYPIIIANSQVYYSVKPGDIFHTDRGKMHSVFNPTDKWVIIEESYEGTFAEEDIIRIFNPNHYH
ncbi:MAG: hypothetical protein JW776_01490 [Candidatus Lokiarchaeota archaeon]|nr:hypothetical protein [Candidatus Lokiarchaeota archaeon]